MASVTKTERYVIELSPDEAGRIKALLCDHEATADVESGGLFTALDHAGVLQVKNARSIDTDEYGEPYYVITDS